MPYISLLSSLLVAIYCIYVFRKISLSEDLKRLRFLWVVAASADLGLFIFAKMLGPNLKFFHFYTILEYILIVMILACWQPDRQKQKLVYYSIGLYLIIYLVIHLTGLEAFSVKTINYITRPIAKLMISIVAFYVLYIVVFKEKSTALEKLAKDYRFWILTAMLLYYYIGSLISAFAKITELSIEIFTVHAALNTVHNLFYMWGIKCAYTRYKNKPDFVQPISS